MAEAPGVCSGTSSLCSDTVTVLQYQTRKPSLQLQVTPAGAVYSEAGMNEVAAQHGGIFVDPITGKFQPLRN